MTGEHWATEELPGIHWDETRQQPNPPTDPDLWGQGLTTFEQHTLTTVTLTGDLL